MPDISPEMREFARLVFEKQVDGKTQCPDCGGLHSRACPRIRRMRIARDPATGAVTETETEYWAPGTWEDDIIWPGDAYDDDDASEGN